MQHRIPMTNSFFAYRRSRVALTEHDSPSGITYTPDPLPQARYIGGPAEHKATHLIINGLSNDWQISPPPILHPSEIAGNPNHPIWICMCSCPLGGVVTVNPPEKYESLWNG